MCRLCRDFVFSLFLLFVVGGVVLFFTVFVVVGNAPGRNDESVTS